MNFEEMYYSPINKKMFLLSIFVFSLPCVFLQEAMTHTHANHHSAVSVTPEKQFITSESTLKNSENDSDNSDTSFSDKPEVHHGHSVHNHNNENKDHSAHGPNLSPSEHSMHNHEETKHDMHSHHDHSQHSEETETKDSTSHHEHANTPRDYDLLGDQPAQDINNLQMNADKQNDKDYRADMGKNYKDNAHQSHGPSHHHHTDMTTMDMDHSMHMDMKNGSDHGMMMMYFHASIEEVVLFKEWKIRTLGELIGSMIGIMILGTFYEALKYFREHLFRKHVSSMQFSTVAVTGESGRVSQLQKVESNRLLSWAHGLQTCLHVVQIITSYFLMLIFMTYNVWLCLAVVVGSALGYFVFGWKKATVVDITEHCH